VTRAAVVLDERRGVRAYVYRPRHAHGVYLVAPGLHYAGPDDPRLDRFCRVLANSGFVVVAPFLPDFLALRIAPTTTADLAIAFEHARAIADAERLDGPAVFSISFGSRPAIELCASDAGAHATQLVLFGGFCDFDATVRFAVGGRGDPLNAPVVFLNLLPFHDDDTLDRELLTRAMRRMVETTWGRPELKIGDRRAAHAKAIIEELALAGAHREHFLRACGLAPGGEEMLERALARTGDAFAWADPRAHLAGMRPPVVVVHGRDDDVIPYSEAEKLARALPPGHPHETILTGLYGHTGAALPSPRALSAELRAMLRIVRVLARAPRLARHGTSPMRATSRDP
jgi:pimeloyl-ACP methyl ester carboxylesterase